MTASAPRLSDRIIPADLARRVPAEFARAHQVLPFEEIDGRVRVAVASEGDVASAKMLGRFFSAEVEAVVVAPDDLAIALDRVYGRAAPAAGVADVPRAGRTQPGGEAAAVRVLEGLLRRAVRDGASDVHIEPFERELRVRMRIDGVLHRVGIETTPPKALATRVKVLASLDAAESRRPQDGRFRYEVEGRVLDVRVSTVPTVFGEKVVLRILDRARALLDLSELGMGGETLSRFRSIIRRPHALVLVTGPTGSGKTTTLYAALSERNEEGLNLTTIEDPVEYDLPGVNQIQVHPKIGLDFARGLRHVLRQDPDVVFVGEIRDAETAEVAIQAALTGHLVFSTLHTNDAVGACARLLEMGIEPFLVADALACVLSQRLVRTLCLVCRRESAATREEAERFGVSVGERVFRAAGCAKCLGTGYRGRTGIYELLSMTQRLTSLVRSRASSEEILAAAEKEGHRRLVEDGLAKVRAGVTTLEEVSRVVL